MKLNNKGFAITAVLYGLLILFVILVSSYLLILSSRKNRLDSITKDIEGGYNNKNSAAIKEKINDIIDENEIPLNNLPEEEIGDIIKNKIKDEVFSDDNNNENIISFTEDDKTVVISPNINNSVKIDVRYSGSNPYNYVFFNCDDYSEQDISSCETWRIIGIVDGKIKLISNESIGQYQWDTRINEWTQSSLQKKLNSNDFKSDYFTPGTVEYIDNAIWYLGGYDSWTIKPNVMLWYERSENISRNPLDGVNRSTTWQGQVGIPYPSDYGYAADLNLCDETFDNYYKCYDYNWMSILFDKKLTWLITPHVVNDNVVANRAWFANENSSLESNGEVFYEGDIYPTVYLAENVKIRDIDGANGSESKPYHVEVSNE